jgi:hypothetical protein
MSEPLSWPVIGARLTRELGQPVPAIVWHGMLDDLWHAVVQTRALDLIALAFDCEHAGDHGPAGHLFARAASVAGRDGLRCLVGYRALAHLACLRRDGQHGAADPVAAVISATLARLSRAYG